MIHAVKQAADAVFEKVVQVRRQIHRNPELAFDEQQTAHLVQEALADLPLKLTTGIAGTGIVATLEGGNPGPTQMLRADMDALPITEATGLPFASENEGIMHACGHDAHTASLLGTALILSQMKDEVPGTVRFLFQPSEERLPGGAKKG